MFDRCLINIFADMMVATKELMAEIEQHLVFPGYAAQRLAIFERINQFAADAGGTRRAYTFAPYVIAVEITRCDEPCERSDCGWQDRLIEEKSADVGYPSSDIWAMEQNLEYSGEPAPREYDSIDEMLVFRPYITMSQQRRYPRCFCAFIRNWPKSGLRRPLGLEWFSHNGKRLERLAHALLLGRHFNFKCI